MLTDARWARIEPLLPPFKGPTGKPSSPHRPAGEGWIYRLKDVIGGDVYHLLFLMTVQRRLRRAAIGCAASP